MSRKYKDYYELKTVETVKGEKQTAVYKGGYYRFAVEDRVRSSFAKKVFGLSLLNIVFFSAAGMTNGDYSRNLFLVLPFVVQFMPAMLILISSFPLIGQMGDLTVPQFKTRFVRIRTMASINVFLASVIVLEAVVFALAGGGIPGTDDLIFAALVVLMGASQVSIIFMHKKTGEDVRLL